MKGFDEKGFRFYTNYDSRKGKELVSEFSWTLTDQSGEHRSGRESCCRNVFLLVSDVTIGSNRRACRKIISHGIE